MGCKTSMALAWRSASGGIYLPYAICKSLLMRYLAPISQCRLGFDVDQFYYLDVQCCSPSFPYLHIPERNEQS